MFLRIEEEERVSTSKKESTDCRCLATSAGIVHCPMHAAAPNLLDALKANNALMAELGGMIAADPNHSPGLMAQIELVRRKTAVTIARAEGK